MARKSTLARVPSEAIEKIQSRHRWPPSELARVLGCGRETVYRLFPGGGQVLSDVVMAAIAAAQGRGHAGEKLATDLGGQG